MPIGSGRITQFQQLHYFRKRITYADRNIAAGVNFGTLPAQAMLATVFANVTAAFNAGTTNVLNVGITPTGGEIIPAATFTAGTGVKDSAATARALTFAIETDLYVSYVQTGAAATTGQADILIAYAPNNDQ